jgi:1-deoxy-D-xylulose-5-phosphate synthase
LFKGREKNRCFIRWIIADTVSEAITLSVKRDELAHYDMRFIKPLDENLLHQIFKKYQKIITIEDGVIQGGFGSSILEFAAQNNYKNDIKILGIPDTFVEHGSVLILQKEASLDVDSLVEIFSKA